MTALAIRDEQHYLATVRDVRDLAERIEHVDDAKQLADKAAAAGVWARRAKLGTEQINLAVAARLWAERRAGELLRDTVQHGGDRRSESRSQASTLNDLGISKSESSRMQHLASIPAEQFQAAVEQASEQGVVSAAKVARIAEGKLEQRVKDECFPAPTPAFDAFWKACGLLVQKARADVAAEEEWDADTRRMVRQWAPVMVERINELAALADDGTLRLVTGGSHAGQ